MLGSAPLGALTLGDGSQPLSGGPTVGLHAPRTAALITVGVTSASFQRPITSASFQQAESLVVRS